MAGMRKPMGKRLTEPGSKRYIDGRPRRASARQLRAGAGFDGPKREQQCGHPDICCCDHTDHATECDPHGCLAF